MSQAAARSTKTAPPPPPPVSNESPMCWASRTGRSTADLPCRNPARFRGRSGSTMSSTRVQTSPPRIPQGTRSNEMGRQLPGFSTGFIGLGIATTNALLQIFGILRWCKQDERKPHSQDFRAASAWSKSSGQIVWAWSFSWFQMFEGGCEF